MDYHQWLQVHICDIMESRHLEEFSMVVSLLNSLLLKEEFIQRSGFTSEPPIVAAATVPKFLEILDPPFLYFVCPTLLHVWIIWGIFSCYSGFRLALCMYWAIRLSSSYDVLSLRFKTGLSFAVFHRLAHVLLLEKIPCFLISSKKIMTLIKGCRLIEFHHYSPRID